jgi:hypothetical protein
MKLGINSKDLQDLIMTQFDWMKDMNNNEGLGKGNPKLGVEFLWGLISMIKSILVFFSLF